MKYVICDILFYKILIIDILWFSFSHPLVLTFYFALFFVGDSREVSQGAKSEEPVQFLI